MARSTARSTTKKGANTGSEAELWAHSRNDEGMPHLLEKHLYGVARRAQEFLALPELKTIGYYAGLWQDGEKAGPELQPHIPTPKASPILGYLAVGLIHAVEWL